MSDKEEGVLSYAHEEDKKKIERKESEARDRWDDYMNSIGAGDYVQIR